LPPHITLRERTAADHEFLGALYASTRAQELAPVPWPDDAKRAFLGQQFQAQTVHYDNHYSRAEFLVIERERRPIGRLYVERRDDDIHVIDISLVPEACGHGLGTELLVGLQREARGAGKTVSIYVEKLNPALRLYRRLGFEQSEDTGVYFGMIWRPDREEHHD
jgi:ribosomal protein S18 acetylase RimI-like enzyme